MKYERQGEVDHVSYSGEYVANFEGQDWCSTPEACYVSTRNVKREEWIGIGNYI